MEFTRKKINGRYEITGMISEADGRVVFNGTDLSTKRQCIIQLFDNERISQRPEDIIRFEADLTALKDHDCPQIITIYDVGETKAKEFDTQPYHYIVTELIEGKYLNDFLSSEERLATEAIVNLIYQITHALIYIHDCGIYHREISPNNIFIPQTADAFNFSATLLTNFGIAHLREYNQLDTVVDISTIFSYMSPEQTGMVKRVVDERSDLYALGIVFYHLLTGALPFTGNTVSEIFHQHVAKIPQPPQSINPDIPQPLADITLKLLEKEPENRYQSAKGLLGDLKKYLRGEMNFMLGLNDTTVKLSFQTSLVGRVHEFDHLKRLFDQACDGHGAMCFVKGEAGRGKTRLIEELKRYVLSKRKQAIHSKRYTSENKIPYGSFKEALDVYVRRYGRHSDNLQKKIKTAIKSRFNNLGQIILQLNPKIKIIIGKCPPLVALEPERESERFLTTLSSFFRYLSRVEHGLLIVIDDLQWSDDGTLDLLQRIIYDIIDSPLLILATYRDNEVVEKHRVHKLITHAASKNLPLDEIHLDVFTREQMQQFVAQLFFENVLNVLSIANLIFDKSKGNPYFAIELLKQFIDEKSIFYHDNRWQINSEILKYSDIAETIIDILLKRIAGLNDHEHLTLSYAAVIGGNFSINILFKLIPVAKKEIVDVIDHALQLQLIELDLTDKGKVFFVHERIKEAFYQSISNEKRRDMHLRVAETYEHMYPNKTDDIIFALAYHYIKGLHAEKIVKYAYIAGVTAQKSYGNEDALRYFDNVLHHIDESFTVGDDAKHNFWVTCKQHIGDIHLTIGNSDHAIATYNELLGYMNTPIKTAHIYKQLCHAYSIKGDAKRCEEFGRKGLAMLGEQLPMNKGQVILSLYKEFIVRLLHTAFPSLFLRRKPHPDHEKNEMIAQFRLPLIKMYLMNDKLKFVQNTLRALNFNESRFGESGHLGRALGGYGLLLANMSFFKPALKHLLRGLKMRQDARDEWGTAQSYQWLAYCHEWSGEHIKALEYYEKALEIFERIGDINEIGMTLNGCIYIKQSIGDFDVRQMIDRYSRIAEKSCDLWQISVAKLFSAADYHIKGDIDTALAECLDAYHITLQHELWHPHCLALSYIGYYYMLKNDSQKSIEYLEKARAIQEKEQFLNHYMNLLYCLLANAYICDFSTKSLQSAAKKQYLKKIKRACHDAMKKTKSWITHHSYALKVTGQYYALTQSNKKAERYFVKSIALSTQMGLKNTLGITYYEYGLFLSRIARHSDAKNQFQAAYKIFTDIGFHFYLERVKPELGIDEASTAMERLMDRQRLSSIMRVSQDISSLLNLDELLEQIMAKAIEVTGAQRGYLFIVDENDGNLILRTSKSIIASPENQYSEMIVNEVFVYGNPIRIANAMSESTIYKFNDIEDTDYKSILCIPIKRHDNILGACYLDNPLTTDVFSEEDIEILSALMTQSAISIENARLFTNIAAKETILRASEEKYRLILESIEDAYYEVDLKGTFIFFNDAACRVYGYPKNEMQGLNYRSYMDAVNAAQTFKTFNTVFKTGLPAKGVESIIIQKDGKKITAETSVSLIINSAGEPIGFRGVTRDISKRKEAEALRIARDVAEKANQAKSDFLANMSHEIRTPMNAILGFSALLKEHVTGTNANQFLNAVISSSKTLMTLINDILDLSKIEAGKLEIQPAAIHPQTIFSEMRDIFSQKAMEKDIEIIVDIAPDLPPKIMMDEIRLRQILLNLIGNAIKFVDKGYVKLSMHCNHHRGSDMLDLFISIADTGIGIPEDQLETVFESFTQQKGQSNAKYGGTGLGLAITKKLTEMMGGTIRVESHIGRGSIFYVTFPKCKIVSGCSLKRSSIDDSMNDLLPSISFEPATVLVADDVSQNRLLIKSYLNNTSVRVIEAKNGDDAVLKVAQYKPDLIFMDIKMSGMDGFTAITKIKQNDVYRSIPIIAITASAMDYDDNVLKTAGCEKVLRKPVSKETILHESMHYLSHTTTTSDTKPAGTISGCVSPETLSLDVKQRLPELNTILSTKMTAVWETIKDGFAFDEIEAFAEQIITLGNDYHLSPLVKWGEEVLFHTSNFDTQHVPKSILKFPEVVRWCSQIEKSENVSLADK